MSKRRVFLKLALTLVVLAVTTAVALFIVSVITAAAAQPKLSISSAISAPVPGQTTRPAVTVDVRLENDIPIRSVMVTFKYNKDLGAITASSFTKGSDIPEGWAYQVGNDFRGVPGVIVLGIADGGEHFEGLKVNGQLLKISFAVSPGAADIVVPIEIDKAKSEIMGVEDISLDFATINGSITVKGTSQQVNKAPTVSAGADFSLNFPGAEADLQGSVTDDGLPTPQVKILWEQVDGPASASVVFTDPTNPKTHAAFPAPGRYILLLTADDGLLSAEDEVAVTVTATPIPTPSPTPTPTPNEARLSVGEVYGAPGSLVEVPVFIGGKKIRVFSMELVVIRDAVVEDAFEGPGLPDDWNLLVNAPKDKTVNILGFDSMDDLDYTKPVVILAIQIGEAKPGDVIPVEIGKAKIVGENFEPLTVTKLNGKIYIVLYGDVDNDGDFDIFDIFSVAKMIVGIDPMPEVGSTKFIVADVNGDMVIDGVDIALMFAVLTGDEEKFPVENS